ncbi:4Fe-4S binding protein [Billgrantia ethanolica]|uniref:4Fe-4S binding protein n=1 Tax=Billgrantia ethanolica TaxID=2733486 RepID=UPI001F275496|nr:4Fe-4S binding protein [Halomonas ethanolica]
MTTRCMVVLEGLSLSGRADQPLIDFLKERGVDLPHLCYHPSLGALETCDACWVEVGDELKRGCTLHNTMVDMQIPIQRYEFQRKPHEKDTSSPFYTYDPDQCILCGRCVEACQNVEVNETLSIDFASENPRVLWDGGEQINDSSCVHCGH